MRNYLIIVFALCFSSFYGQEGLFVEDNRITWQKVYDSDLSQEEIREILKENPTLTNIADDFTGDSKPVDLKCEQNQAIFMDDDIFFFVVIEMKENKYRVTVNNIRLIPSNTTSLWGVESSTEPNPYEEIMLRNRDGELRKNKLAENSRECISSYLDQLFNLKKSEDSW